MHRTWETGGFCSAANSNLRVYFTSLKWVMLVGVVSLAPTFGPTLAVAQSVTGTGDVIPAVPSPPLPSWDLTGQDLTIGNTGTGSLTIEGGGSVLSEGGIIGAAANSVGEVTVKGPGSKWISSGAFGVGAFGGKGTLTISNGGKVQSGSLVNIGQNAGSEGFVRVTGADSSWTMSNQLVVGFGLGSGTKGTVIVEDGALLESGFAIIGNFGDTEGLVEIRGAGSVWNLSGQLIVGQSDNAVGTLRIEDGGLVTAGGDIIVANPIGATAIGTLAIDSTSRIEGGNIFRQGANGTYIVGIGDSTAGLILVAGAADITAGAKLEAVLGGSATYQTGDRFLVLDAASVTDNAFTLVNAGAVSSFLSIDDVYDTANGDVFIEVTVTRSLTDAALTPNQIATAEGAESSAAAGGLFQVLGSDAEVQDALDQASGEVHASIKSMLIGDSGFLREAVTNRLRAAAAGGETMGMAAANGDGWIEPTADLALPERHFDFWLSGFGSWGDWDGDDNVAALDRSVGGIFVGADTQLDDWRLGAVAGYSNASFDVDERNSSGSVDGYHIGIYGGTTWESIAVRAGASYTLNDIETSRDVTNPAVQELEADYDAHTIQVFGELAYVADLGGLILEPFANVAYINLHTESFEETGGSLALESKSDDTDNVATTLGLRPEVRFSLGELDTRWRGLIGWRHAFGDVTPESRLAFGGGDAFTIRGVPMARDTAIIEAGLDLALTSGATLGASYRGEFGNGVSDNGFTARLGIAF